MKSYKPKPKKPLVFKPKKDTTIFFSDKKQQFVGMSGSIN